MDVIVIGGGLAGLAAVRELTRAGKTVVLLEAQHRLGGRVLTHHISGFPHPIELGPEWIDGSSLVADVIHSAGGSTIEANGARYMRAGQGWKNLDEPPKGSENLVERIRKLPGDDRSLLEALDLCCGDAKRADARAQLISYVQGFHAADPAKLSSQWLVTVERNQPADASGYHATAGLDAIVKGLMPAQDDRLVIQLDTVVEEIHWSRGTVTISARRGGVAHTYQAPRCISTLPLPILQQGQVRFEPALESKRSALELMEMGQAVKIVLRMSRPFWEDIPGLKDLLFLHDFDQPFPTWWTTRPVQASIITGWTAGPQVEELGGAEGDQLLPLALNSLAMATGRPEGEVAGLLKSWHCHDWRRDPFARGAYSYVLVGGVNAYRSLAEPLDDTLYFAGEATAGEGYNATMEGAVQSGRRAAREILAN